MSVQLIIKSAAQNVEDFKLQCDLSWTIAQVKDQITSVYPTKPAREHQKLIHAGKLLPDHLPLKSILNQSQDLHIIHLVCPPPNQASNKLYSNNQKPVPENTASPTYTVPPLNPSNIYPQANQPLQPSTPFTSNAPPVFPAGTPADAIHQYLAMQQMYNQFMAQYLSQFNINVPPGQVPRTTPHVQQSAPPPAAPRPIVEDRPEGERWDFVDFLYACSRIIIFISIIVYYSSFSRIMAVCSLVFLLTLFAKMNQRRQDAQLANQRQRTEQNTRQEPQAENDNTPDTEVVNENASDDNLPVAPNQPNAQSALSVPSLILSVVTSFFTSMIPNDPMPVNVN